MRWIPAFGCASLAGMDARKREWAAQEQRCWVRLTRACNNRCLFCLDAEVQDGSQVPLEQVRTEILAGRQRKATRLILSGGEPTIHRHYLELLAFGKKQDYQWVQTISNGRMFAYRKFAEQARQNGLDEATFSMHGHQGRLHDRLVGVEGAFAQSMQGMDNLQRIGVVVNVDVVLTPLNLDALPQIIEFFLNRGINEFDLLWPVPFGRAWENRRNILWPRDARSQPLLDAIAVARRAGATVWTNRLPAQLLEGFEDLIQDPHKLHDEVRGRSQELVGWLEQGTPLPCREPKRCRFCFLQQFCAALDTYLGAGPAPAGPETKTARQARTPARIAELLQAGGELEIVLNQKTAAWVKDNVALIRSRPDDFSFSLETFLTLREMEQQAVDPVAALRPLHGTAVNLVDIPRCVLPDAARVVTSKRWWREYPEEESSERLERLVDDFVLHAYRVQSLRCKGCAYREECPGLPINHVRQYGFSLARPLGREEGNELCDVALGEGDQATMVIRTRCSNGCIFCTTGIIAESNRAPWKVDPLPVIERTLEELRRQGRRRLRLAAIEPFEHPDIIDVLEKARSLGFAEIEIWSHAGPASDADLARRLLDAGMTALDVPLFGPDARTHDAIAGRLGAFAQTLQGLENLRRLGFSAIASHMVVARGNHRLVAETFRFAATSPFGALGSVIVAAPSVPDPQRYRPVVFPLMEMVEALATAGQSLGENELRALVGLVSRSVPHCLLLRAMPDCRPWLAQDAAPSAAQHSVEVKSYSKNLLEKGRRTWGADLKRRQRCPLHRQCALAEQCPGLYPFYLQIYGPDELAAQA